MHTPGAASPLAASPGPGGMDGLESACIDRDLMASVLLLSSSEPARRLAAVWLEIFDVAVARGASIPEALARAREACRPELAAWSDPSHEPAA